MPSRAKRIDRLNELLSHYSEKLKQEKRAERKQEHKVQKAERSLENRRKFIKGALLDKMVEWGWLTEDMVMQGLDQYLIDRDRDLFGLPPRETVTPEKKTLSVSATTTQPRQFQDEQTNGKKGQHSTNSVKRQQEEAQYYQEALQTLASEDGLREEKTENQDIRDRAAQQQKVTPQRVEQESETQETMQVISKQPVADKPKTLTEISQDKMKEMFEGI
ncbi:hypothetical protein [Nostoc sp. ChiQUE01b]|uniref:hypothetical protein n=1 Tax=Nostoc sp. ChiQUE01b TaxID=3075376 RepID=UPI002AD5AACE|nr:hypothetical protein [Nostoc sp. ChiQUE01b]MDZ8260593.1 hypothetical protein [Nostoc sp. ChiQUE01b]